MSRPGVVRMTFVDYAIGSWKVVRYERSPREGRQRKGLLVSSFWRNFLFRILFDTLHILNSLLPCRAAELKQR